ncbi:MAG: hypothetical protein JNL90_07020 [Planctomycetes bacterium]|nr:hypothetical protein [Planctomycetota bacterium]
MIVDHAVTVVLHAFGLFGDDLTTGTVEALAAVGPMDSRSTIWKSRWRSLDLVIGAIDLSRLEVWVDRIEAFQPSPEQLKILEVLNHEALKADALGHQLWPRGAGRQSSRLLHNKGFKELVELGLVAQIRSAGYYLPFAPPTGLSPGIPKPIAIPRARKRACEP